jgi:hypothetical protein
MKFARMAVVLAVGVGAWVLFSVGSAPGRQAPTTDVTQTTQTTPYPLMSGMGKKDPELDKLTAAEAEAAREVAKLVAEYKQTEDDAERTKIKTKLSAALSKQFDQQQKRRELELARAEAQLKKVRELMKKRGEERKTIVEKRLDQVVREAEGLGWTPPPSSGTTRGNGLSTNNYSNSIPAKK